MMSKRSNAVLLSLQKIAEELNYSTELVRQSEDTPYDILSILWDMADDKEQSLDLIIYPFDDGLEGSVFVQLYAEYPFSLHPGNLALIVDNLPMVNNKLPLGHFDISQDKQTLYFKYMLALQLGCEISSDFLSDVLDMCIYAYEAYMEGFQSLCIPNP